MYENADCPLNRGEKCAILFPNQLIRNTRGLKRGGAMFFNSDYNDLLTPEPETEEAPPKKGVSCFFDLLGRHCVALVKVNLLFLLGCVPIVTIPLSLFALDRVVCRMVLDRPFKCFQVYWETFRRSWKQSYPAFLLTALPLGCAGFGMWFYLNRASSNPLFFLPFLVCSTIFLVTLLSSGCLYGLLDSGKGLKEALRLALLLGITKPARTVPAALCCFGLFLLAVVSFPLSGLYLLLLGFSLPCMLGNFYLRTMWSPFNAGNENPSETDG